MKSLRLFCYLRTHPADDAQKDQTQADARRHSSEPGPVDASMLSIYRS